MHFERVHAVNFLSHVDTEVKLQGYDAVVVVGPNGSGKCLVYGEDVLLANGRYERSERLIGLSFDVLSFDDGKLVKKQACAWPNGIESAYRIETSFGRRLLRTANHPFLGQNGFVLTKDLKEGDALLSPCNIPINGQIKMDDTEIKLLAYFIGDGGVSGDSPMFTQQDGPQLDEFDQCVKAFDCYLKGSGKFTYRVVHKRSVENPVTLMLARYGLLGRKSYLKTVPAEIFQLSNEQIALFLSRLFGTDGWASTYENVDRRNRGVKYVDASIGYASVSYKLMLGVQRLLLRFGIAVPVYNRVHRDPALLKRRDQGYHSWRLEIGRKVDIHRFADRVGIFGKEDKVRKCNDVMSEKYHLTPKHLKDVPYPKFFWDRVKRVSCIGKAETVGITVPGNETFVTDAVEHNSSIMIDAPLVALFGKGRSGDLDGYVRNGASLMSVEVDFPVNGSHYRAVRKRSIKTARGVTTLEFYQIDEDGSILKQLTAGSIGETESLIRKTLGYDFDTLVRSNVIEQGEADYFCKASPSERMELFAKIWDLDKYDDFAQMARDVWKEKRDRVKGLEERIILNNQKIFEIDKNSEEMAKLKVQIDRESGVIAGIEKKKSELEKKVGAFDAMVKELGKAVDYHSKTEREIGSVSGQHDELIQRIDRFNKVLKNKDVVFGKVDEEKVLVEEITGIETAIRELIKKVDDVRWVESEFRKKMQVDIDAVEDQKRSVDGEIDCARELLNEANKDLARIGRKEDQLKQMHLAADKLKGVQCHPDYDVSYVNETCLFIKDAVDAKRNIPKLEVEIKEEKESAEQRFAQADLMIVSFSEKKSRFDATIKVLKQKMSVELPKYESQIAGLLSERRGVEAELKDKKTALDDVKRYTKLLPEISLAESEMPKLIEDERALANKCNEVVAERDRQAKEIDKLKEGLKGKDSLEKELQSVCNSLATELVQKEGLVKRYGFIEAEMKQRDGLKAQVEKDEKECEVIGCDAALYQMAEDAFKQIPYMLISRGIGAVENIANEILSMISSSGLRVTIETERMAKTTKKIRDEIHLTIQDNDGKKDYKFLSGGEKLRVAMATRIAIGEVFAHRRGVRVDSLIADEPFGALDTEGIEDMKEAMRELQKRFKFMAVVTHIERAQDIFPTRLLFERADKGTTITIEEGV